VSDREDGPGTPRGLPLQGRAEEAGTSERARGEGPANTAGSQTPVELIRALAHLVEAPRAKGGVHGSLARALDLPDPPTSSSYHDLFGMQLYPYASVYLGEEGMLGGEARARIEGFWQAVGREPPPEPDHLASLLGLYAALVEEALEAAEGPARALLVDRAARSLLELHLAPWVFWVLDRAQAIATPFYRAWAGLLAATLEDELARQGPVESPSPHLDVVGPVPHPATEGAAPFLMALLAPARSGVLCTRADLGRLARTLGLGLRAGERRYAIEHLLAQDARGVIAALSDEAAAAAAGHRRRAGWLGRPARVLAERAEASRELLSGLAAEGLDRGVSTEPPPRDASERGTVGRGDATGERVRT